jgi:myo-inositol-1(or 4)-monophosphatase
LEIPDVKESKFIRTAHRVALASARRAGKYLLKRFKSGDIKINSNSMHDVKLDVDVEAENLIKAIIRGRFPDHGFICEESGEENFGAEYNWVIDPLDGTVNFSKGIPHFCTSIALKKSDRTLLGVVYDPAKEEIFSGVQGTGATFNGAPIRRENIERLEDAVIVMGYFKSGSIEEGIRMFERISHRVKKMRFFGSAALDLCYLACGRVNAYVQHSLNEWDIAAASLIAELSGVQLQTIQSGSSLNVIGADREIFENFKSIIWNTGSTESGTW